MLVDTLFNLPEWFPYWIEIIVFFMITLPVNLFTLVDDLLGAFFVYQRFSVHEDFFDLGIVGGKLSRMVFQLYIGIFMLWRYMLKFIPIPGWVSRSLMYLKFW